MTKPVDHSQETRETTRRDVHAAMLDAWNTICADTDCHPLDIERRGGKLFFTPKHWADLVALYLDADDAPMPSDCDWPDRIFTFRNESGEHDPCYVVMPDGAMLPLNHHAKPGVDIARAKFIVGACNRALAPDIGRSLQENATDRPAAFLAWAVEMFGPVAKVRGERLMRFVEEAIELAHADNMELETLHAIIRRVYSRPAGTIEKEIGQAQACLETYAENCGYSSADLAEREWRRVQGIPKEEWTRRHSAKQAIGIALSSAGSDR